MLFSKVFRTEKSGELLYFFLNFLIVYMQPDKLTYSNAQKDLLVSKDLFDKRLVSDLRLLIFDARNRVARQVNSELVLLYWNVDQKIKKDADFEIVATLSRQLSWSHFVERQKRISIDKEDYYLDLLFFHRKLNRLVAIELKLGKFNARDKGEIGRQIGEVVNSKK